MCGNAKFEKVNNQAPKDLRTIIFIRQYSTMCGRARVAVGRAAMSLATGLPPQRFQDDIAQQSHNMAPGGWIPVIRPDKDGNPEVQSMKWGLVPSFHQPGDKVDHWRMFNARSETVHTSPVFRRLLAHKRCVVLLNGFYEWKADAGGRKQPYYIYVTAPAGGHSQGSGGKAGGGGGKEEQLMAVAGLWDVTTGDDGQPLYTVTLLTCDSCDSLTWLHDRMPVLLDSLAAVEAWLGAPLPTGCTLFGGKQQQQQQEQHQQQHQQQLQAAPSSPAAALSPASPAAPAGTATSSGSPNHAVTAPASAPQPPQAEGSREEGVREAGGSDLQGAAAAASVKHEETPGSQPTTSQQQGEHGTHGAAAVKQEQHSSQPSTSQQEAHGDAAVKHEEVKPSPSRSHDIHGHHGGKDEGVTGEDIMALIKQVCHPGHLPLAWHPVTPDMTKMTYQSPDACADIRTRKGNIASFFTPKGKTPAAAGGATTAGGKGPTAAGDKGAAAAAGGKGPAAGAAPAGGHAGTAGSKRKQQQEPSEDVAGSKKRAPVTNPL